MKQLLSLLCVCCLATVQPMLANDRWQLTTNDGIVFQWQGEPMSDHMEMSGKRMSMVLRYGIQADGRFWYNRGMVWPLLRTVPNDTHGNLRRRIGWNPIDLVECNNSPLSAQPQKVESITLRQGTMTVESRLGGTRLRHVIAPSTEQPMMVETFTLTNTTSRTLRLFIDSCFLQQITPQERGVDGAYRIVQTVAGTGRRELLPGDSTQFSAAVYAQRIGDEPLVWDAKAEIAKRKKLVNQWQSDLVLETPDSVLNRMFAFSKVRALESIYQTKAGPMHGPGGEAYYAAIWANDQAEYANPFFPLTDYDYACASAINSFRLFATYMNPEYKPIPSSIIAEGDSYWNGAGDRGDAAMIAYGAARYVLARGDIEEARQLWPLITWCLEYCRRQLNDAGVVRSDHDELEGRFPAGEANLCTSSLYYDALCSAAMLARDLHVKNSYKAQAATLRKNLDAYFHASMEGFDTYRYYDGNTALRSWICIPLTMGIFDRAEGTIGALFSPHLWTDNGMLTQAGDRTFWDRTTLYALRGTLMAGATELTLGYLQSYSHARLLGSHVPYAIEAWPEGNQRHLSAESALYARIITEGLFGIRPTGLHSFSVDPRLPEAWPEMTLRRVRIAGSCYDITVRRDAKGKVAAQITELK